MVSGSIWVVKKNGTHIYEIDNRFLLKCLWTTKSDVVYDDDDGINVKDYIVPYRVTRNWQTEIILSNVVSLGEFGALAITVSK